MAAAPLRLVATTLALLVLGAAPAAGRPTTPEQLRSYRNRLQGLFLRYDRNGDGRLEAAEVRGHPYLERRLRRLEPRRSYLIRSDLTPTSRSMLGERLRLRFRQADRNGDGRLTRSEAGRLPWVLERFEIADIDGDQSVTLQELWTLRRALSPRPDGRGR
jgi:Ca2+-binding EF-hand superfamily protein